MFGELFTLDGVNHFEIGPYAIDFVVVGPFQENSYFLRLTESDEVLLFDPGDSAERLIALIDENSWKPVAIVNTHAHLDHIGAVAAIKRRYDVPFYLHPEEKMVLKSAPMAAMMFGVQPPEMPGVDHWLDPTQSLELAGMQIKMAHTPGHSPGSVSFIFPQFVIAGDVLFNGSIGRTDLPGGDYQTLIDAIHRELLVLDDETVVFCGHGPATAIGRERRSNPFLR